MTSPPINDDDSNNNNTNFHQVDFINFRTGISSKTEARVPGVDSHLWEYAASISAQQTSLSDRLPKTQILCCRVSFLNVVLLGIAFMLNIGAYTTAGMVQTLVLASDSSKRDLNVTDTSTLGYVLWAVSTGTQSLSYLFGPTIVAITGPKLAMFVGSVFVSLYVACFIRPYLVTLILGAVFMGFGVGIIWEVQGHFVTINSTSKRVLRNTAVFWGLYQSSLVTGNLFYFLMLRGHAHVSEELRHKIFITLLVAACVGCLFMCTIVHPWVSKIPRPPLICVEGSITESTDSVSSIGSVTTPRGPKEALVVTFQHALRKDMLWLLPIFFYIGMEGSFWVNVYGTAIGYTEAFNANTTDPDQSFGQGLVGLSGVFIGVGEIVGGILLGLLGKWMHYNGKETVLIFGLIIHLVAYYLTFINLPAAATLGPTATISYQSPNAYVAMSVSFMLGLGDAIWNSQLMGYLGCVYRHECVTVYAVYQFWCAVAGAAAFVWAGYLTLPYQLLILAISALPAAAGFCKVEWQYLKVMRQQLPAF